MSCDDVDLEPADSGPVSLADARYWFEQYRFAAAWESRLIRDIAQLTSGDLRVGELGGETP